MQYILLIDFFQRIFKDIVKGEPLQTFLSNLNTNLNEIRLKKILTKIATFKLKACPFSGIW